MKPVFTGHFCGLSNIFGQGVCSNFPTKITVDLDIWHSGFS